MLPTTQTTVLSQSQDDFQLLEPSLTQRSVHGFLWLFSQTVVTRLVSFAGQLTLAWLLEPSAFGLIALATSIQTFTTLVQQNGLNQILVARQSEYSTLANPAFWYSLSVGLIAALLMAVVAPVASHAFGHPELLGLVLIMAAAAPFDAMCAVPAAKLGIDLRFRTSAMFSAASITSSMALTITFAALGFGVYSFALPLLIVTPATTLVFLLLTRPPLQFNPQFNQWRSLLSVSGILLLAGICNRMMQRGDYLILGAFYSPEQVGVYFMAYSLSVQTVMLLGSSVDGVLFASLSKLQHDVLRHRNAFLRSCRLLAWIVIPGSFFLAVIAQPFVRLAYDDKWLAVIPILQVLALSMSMRPLAAAAGAHIQSRGKFGIVLVAAVLKCILFLTFALGAASFDLVYFAAAIGVFFLLDPIINMCFALGFNRRTIITFVGMVLLPLVASITACVAAACIGRYSSETTLGLALTIISSMAVFCLAPCMFARQFDPVLWAEIAKLKTHFLHLAKLRTLAPIP